MKRRAITQADIQASLLANPALRAANPGIEAQLGGVGMGSNRPVVPVLDVSGVKTAKKGKRRREMNATEREFSMMMDREVSAGKILSWEYEEITLRWPDGMRYTPDFVVVHEIVSPYMDQPPKTQITLVEIKGAYAWRQDVVKFRAARDKWGNRYRFEFWQKIDGQWSETR